MRALFFQHPPYREEHGEKAGAPADEVGHRLCQEDAAGAKAGYRGEPQSQRDDDDGLSQKGEEHRLLGAPQRHRGALAGHLQAHHEEAEEIDVHGGHALFQKLRFAVKKVDEEPGKEKQQSPEEQGEQDTADGHEPDG